VQRRVKRVGICQYPDLFLRHAGHRHHGEPGALLNEKAGSSLAKGIGIQVLKEGVPLEFNKKYSVGTLRTQETRYITLPLHARFYQYAPTTSTGEVESHMIFNLTYD
jgi:type 1 fimbria pilin